MSSSGRIRKFHFDSLTRSISKKSSISEILDSDESVAQDQGNTSPTFSMNIYFIGEDYDLSADLFWNMLEEKYTVDEPGLLMHPRWGDINVFPMSWSQTEEFVDGAQVARFTVEFRKVFPTDYPTTDEQTESDALSNLDEMSGISADAAANMKLKKPSWLANIAGKIVGAVGLMFDALSGIAELQEDLISVYESIHDGINAAVDDVAGNIINIMSGTQTLLRLPAQIYTSTLDKINSYRDLIEDLGKNFLDLNETDIGNKTNNATMFQLICGMASAALAEAAVFTDYGKRSDGIDAIDIVTAGYDSVLAGMESARVDGLINEMYIGDHNFLSLLQDTISRINALLLNKSFNLKAEKKIVLKNSSDAITLCYKFYKSVSNEKMDFFIATNNLTKGEFIEIQAGREVVYYG